MGKKQAQTKLAFWKKQSPEITRITGHLGRIIDNGHATDYLLNGALALMGANATKDLRGAVLGPLGLKLAQSGSEIVGGVGLSMLAGLGIITVAPEVLDIFDYEKAVKSAPSTPTEGFTKDDPNAGCKEGTTKMINFGSLLCVPNEYVAGYEYRGWEKYSDYIARTS